MHFPEAAGTYQSCFRNVDIGFIVDSSNSSGNYQKQKHLVQRLASSFDVSKAGTRVGVVIYGDNAHTIIGLNSYRDSSILQKAIGALPRLGGGNRKDRALLNARRMFKSTNRNAFDDFHRISKVLVFITEGNQTHGSNLTPLLKAVHPLRKHGVRVIMVGVGDQVSYEELRTISRDPNDIYLVRSFDNLDKISAELMTKICRVNKIFLFLEIKGECNIY